MITTLILAAVIAGSRSRSSAITVEGKDLVATVIMFTGLLV